MLAANHTVEDMASRWAMLDARRRRRKPPQSSIAKLASRGAVSAPLLPGGAPDIDAIAVARLTDVRAPPRSTRRLRVADPSACYALATLHGAAACSAWRWWIWCPVVITLRAAMQVAREREARIAALAARLDAEARRREEAEARATASVRACRVRACVRRRACRACAK